MPDNTVYEDVDNEDFYSYASPNYLGKSGITRPCVESMAAILTSAFRPPKITLMSMPHRSSIGSPHDSVMFFVWDWPSDGRGTIVPDDFGTHGGEGSAGLATVLGLIRFYGVPLEHVVIYDNDMWDQVAEEGKLTPQMFDILLAAHPYNWNYYRVEEARLLKKGREIFLEVDYWKFRIAGPAVNLST